ncbi:hypothetical protein F5887DRAFT_873757 [Amanita rubescens]|nr:hypothetical protein F5887DRAFT_873757 [Amanita rubescens]
MDHAVGTDVEGDPGPWLSEAPAIYSLRPDNEKSWEVCDELAQKTDESRYEGWKDDVKNMLIFAGLFSAVVTGFTTQAYPLLLANSNLVTAQLLAIMAQQQVIGSSSSTEQQQLLSIVSGLQDFTPPPYAIRVNILWFLSLSVSLMTAIVGLLCMQWLHEYRHEITGLPHMETFAMRQIRREGLEKWQVPAILSLVSIFLQLALLLFFIGLLDFLWHLNGAKTVATVISIFCGIAFLFLAATTVSPALQFLLHPSDHLHIPQCPYKSPQAWAFCQLCFHLSKLLSHIMPLNPDAINHHDITWMERRSVTNLYKI